MIRPALPTDAGDLHAIWTPVIRETTHIFHTTERSEEEIAALTQGEDPFLVWADDGRVLGFARCFPFRAGNGYTRTVEHTILLAPNARSRGIGRSLMDALAQAAAAQGKHAMIGAISAENEAAIAFHAACGFQAYGRLPEVGYKFGRWLDLVLMGRRL
ncbi:N-acetyltransferase family protein [Rubellimicrobium rubrum]|uniref:N-acetyltransferase family protein n=1 Tax=Rubellimicrobium rubrum TaxID=2585369 RepID=A0A5C4MSZ5_9RHOB|nr:GNAT family N-acetyltransferase [Rubellimicrobium rubrum]TNC47217.1 N-acetyltransferase family protein [Rubellimicrobium rubrum]